MSTTTKEKVWTIEAVDKHIYSQAEKFGIKNLNDANLTSFNLCQVYTIARPILLIVKGILFFKPTWQTVIASIVSVLDTQCNITS